MKVISPAAIAASPLIRAATFAQTFREGAQDQSRFHDNVCKLLQQVTQVTLRYYLGTAAEGVQKKMIDCNEETSALASLDACIARINQDLLSALACAAGRRCWGPRLASVPKRETEGN